MALMMLHILKLLKSTFKAFQYFLNIIKKTGSLELVKSVKDKEGLKLNNTIFESGNTINW